MRNRPLCSFWSAVVLSFTALYIQVMNQIVLSFADALDTCLQTGFIHGTAPESEYKEVEMCGVGVRCFMGKIVTLVLIINCIDSHAQSS